MLRPNLKTPAAVQTSDSTLLVLFFVLLISSFAITLPTTTATPTPTPTPTATTTTTTTAAGYALAVEMPASSSSTSTPTSTRRETLKATLEADFQNALVAASEAAKLAQSNNDNNNDNNNNNNPHAGSSDPDIVARTARTHLRLSQDEVDRNPFMVGGFERGVRGILSSDGGGGGGGGDGEGDGGRRKEGGREVSETERILDEKVRFVIEEMGGRDSEELKAMLESIERVRKFGGGKDGVPEMGMGVGVDKK